MGPSWFLLAAAKKMGKWSRWSKCQDGFWYKTNGTKLPIEPCRGKLFRKGDISKLIEMEVDAVLENIYNQLISSGQDTLVL